MTLEVVYTDMVLDLIKDPETILDTLTPQKVNIWHLCTGLVGEINEVMEIMCTGGTLEQLTKELGDTEFYFAGLCSAFEYDSAQVFRARGYDERFNAVMCVSVQAGRLIDTIKKVLVHNNEVDTTQLGSMLEAVGCAMANLYIFTGIPRSAAIESNVSKLLARYPNGYSDEAAKARKDVE